jgi:hypothetical protein
MSKNQLLANTNTSHIFHTGGQPMNQTEPVTEKTLHRCSRCGNTESFTKLVWQHRRYQIDGHGETTSVSEPVEATEIPIQVSCADGTLIKRGKFPVSGWLFHHELPACQKNKAKRIVGLLGRFTRLHGLR